jgi:hypothetical protein
MKKITAYALKCLALIAATVMIGSGIMNAQTPVKRVLVEEGTGAWCGFCPRGATTLLNTIEKYPGKVIGVAVHNNQGNPANDYMAIADENAYSAAFMNGFPNMTIDRKRYAGISGNKIGVSDGAIVGPIQTQMAQKAKVDVTIENLVYSSANRTLTVDVKGAFVAAVTGDIRFNIYIVEDSVKGNGQGYDQHNYMSKTGSSPDPNSPWYNFPPTITNFYHRHVLRAMLGGTWGTNGVIPSTVASGDTYSKTYTYKLPATWNDKRISVVGIVQMYSSDAEKREILNAVEQGLNETKLPLIGVKADVTDPYLRAGISSKITKKVIFTNTNSTDVDVDIALDIDNSTLPGGWGTKVEPTSATIPANGGTVEATVTIETDASLDFAKAIVTATPVVKDAIPVAGIATVYALSEGIKYAVIGQFNPLSTPFNDAITTLDVIGDQAKVFTWQTDQKVLEAFADQFNVVAMSFSGGLIYNQGLTLLNGTPLAADETANPDYPNMAKYIKTVMAAGKRVFVSVPNGLALNKVSGAINQDATDFYAMLGVELAKQNQHYTVSGNSYTPTQYTVSGITNEICAGITATANTNLNNGYAFWTNSMKLSPGSTSVPIFSMSGSPSDILGVRYEATNKARVVFLTFDMAAFGNSTINNQILTKTMNWLAEGLLVKPKAPVIATINDVDFGEVELKKSKDITVDIANSGDADLVITNIEVLINKDFKLKSVSLPMTIKPGEKTTITITFTPTSKGDAMSGVLRVTSNDPKSNSVTAELNGVGKEVKVESVYTPADQATTLLGMTAGPNPAISKSTISYTIGGVSPQAVEMYVVDIRGARVATLVDNLTLAPGNYSATINAAGLANGSYHVIARTAVETVQLPLVINH